jgi:NADP-dependent 3-hydroxy acid dehydrogenase YdfG
VVKSPVADQVIVVSGASSGIGRAVACAAGERGASVVVSARNVEALDNAVREIEAAGGQGLAVQGEATSECDAENLCARAIERFGRIDTFVATVMVTVYTEVEQLEVEELRRVLDVNFLGRAYAYSAALPHLKASRGTFIDVNSSLAYRGIPLQGAYCASKAAARAYFESARLELEKEQADVDLCQKLGLQPRPVPPIYQPETVAAAVLHCCERPQRELPVTWAAQKLLWGQKLAPRAVDLVLLRSGWSGQTTGEPKPVDSPDNLWETIPGDPGAHGRFDAVSRTSSAWTEARLRLGKVGLAAVLAVPALAASIGYHRITRRGAKPL